MEQVLQALGQLLLRAVPTFVLVLLLYVFLSRVFFRPLEQIMKRRYEDSEGAMVAARQSMADAEQRTAEYQQALRDARADLFRIQERERQQIVDETAEQVRRARAQAEEHVQQAREQLRAETEAAKAHLEQVTPELAQSIAQTVLKPEPAR